MDYGYCTVKNTGSRNCFCVSCFPKNLVEELPNGKLRIHAGLVESGKADHYIQVALFSRSARGSVCYDDSRFDFLDSFFNRYGGLFPQTRKVGKASEDSVNRTLFSRLPKDYVSTVQMLRYKDLACSWSYNGMTSLGNCIVGQWAMALTRKWIERGLMEPGYFLEGIPVKAVLPSELRLITRNECQEWMDHYIGDISCRSNTKDIWGIIPLYERLFGDFGFVELDTTYLAGQTYYRKLKFLPFVLIRESANSVYEVTLDGTKIINTKYKDKILPAVQRFLMAALLEDGGKCAGYHTKHWKLVIRKDTKENALKIIDDVESKLRSWATDVLDGDMQLTQDGKFGMDLMEKVADPQRSFKARALTVVEIAEWIDKRQHMAMNELSAFRKEQRALLPINRL